MLANPAIASRQKISDDTLLGRVYTLYPCILPLHSTGPTLDDIKVHAAAGRVYLGPTTPPCKIFEGGIQVPTQPIGLGFSTPPLSSPIKVEVLGTTQHALGGGWKGQKQIGRSVGGRKLKVLHTEGMNNQHCMQVMTEPRLGRARLVR